MIRSKPTLGLVGSFLGDTHGISLYRGVQRVAAKRGANLAVFTFEHDFRRPALRELVRSQVDAALFVVRGNETGGLLPADLPNLLEGRPAMTLVNPLAGLRIARMDAEAGFTATVAHMVERHGCRRLAVLASAGDLAVCHASPATSRFALDKSLFIEAESHLPVDPGAILSVLRKADGVVCMYATLARQIVSHLERAGILVPDDVPVAAISELPGLQYQSPSMTATDLSHESLAEMAANHLLDCVEKGERPSDLLVSSELVPRESCGCLFMESDANGLRGLFGPAGASDPAAFHAKILAYALGGHERITIKEVGAEIQMLTDAFLKEYAGGESGGFRQVVGLILDQNSCFPTAMVAIRRAIWAVQRIAMVALGSEPAARQRVAAILRAGRDAAGERGAWQTDTLYPVPRATLVKCARAEGVVSSFVAPVLFSDQPSSPPEPVSPMRTIVVIEGTKDGPRQGGPTFGALNFGRSNQGSIVWDYAENLQPPSNLGDLFPRSEPFVVFAMAVYTVPPALVSSFIIAQTEDGVVMAESYRRGLSHAFGISWLHARDLKQKSELARVNSDLEAFAYTVSHDLKAPLRGIASVAGWLATDCASRLSAEEREMLALMQARVYRMHRLIDGILRYSRAGHAPGHAEETDLGRLVREIVDGFGFGKEVSVETPGSMPVLWCDPTSVGEVFGNLLSNSVKHNDKQDKRVTVLCEKGDKFWRFGVADNGPGIPERHFLRVFQMFQTLSSKQENTGVGLSIVQKLVQGWGGRVWVESAEGKGTTFWFTIPCEQARPAQRQGDTPGGGDGPGARRS